MNLFEFLDRSVTAWHAADEIAKELKKNGFEKLLETEPWTLKTSGAYFVMRGAAVFAFRTPSKWTANSRFHLTSAHTDFPAMKITPNPDKESAGIHLIHPEVYGGALFNTWFDRDLGIAGIAVVNENGKPEHRRFPNSNRSLHRNSKKFRSFCKSHCPS